MRATFFKLLLTLICVELFANVCFAEGERRKFPHNLETAEKVEYEVLEQRIKEMPDEEYKRYLTESLLEEFNGSTQYVHVVVETTDAEPLSLSDSEVRSLGASMLSSVLLNHEPDDFQLASQPVVWNSKKFTEFSLESGSEKFELLGAKTNNLGFQALINLPQVKSVATWLGDPKESMGVAYYRNNGRLVPRFTSRQYSKEFYHKGYREDLILTLKHEGTALISAVIVGGGVNSQKSIILCTP